MSNGRDTQRGEAGSATGILVSFMLLGAVAIGVGAKVYERRANGPYW